MYDKLLIFNKLFYQINQILILNPSKIIYI